MYDPVVTSIQFVLAAAIDMPVFQRLKLGAILGYLGTGRTLGTVPARKGSSATIGADRDRDVSILRVEDAWLRRSQQ